MICRILFCLEHFGTWKNLTLNEQRCYKASKVTSLAALPTYPYGKSLYKPYIVGINWVIIPKNP